MLQVLANVQADPIKNVLPKEPSVLVNDVSSDMPSHMLAVYSRRPSTTCRRRITPFPSHHINLASHCANLPKLPAAPKAKQPETPGSRLTVPVVPVPGPPPTLARRLPPLPEVQPVAPTAPCRHTRPSYHKPSTHTSSASARTPYLPTPTLARRLSSLPEVQPVAPTTPCLRARSSPNT
jgi:hypothetical protein